MRACTSTRGTFGVLALDHRQNLRRELRPDDPAATTYEEMVDLKRAVVRALACVATGVLLDPEVGVAQCIADGSLPAQAGLIVAVERTGYQGPPTARVSRLLDGWGVRSVKRMGADAAKLLVYYHPEAATAPEQERLVAEVAAACAGEDLALFVEPLTYSTDPAVPKLIGEARRRAVLDTARRLTSFGGDVLKSEFPYDPSVTDERRWREACEELTAASRVPWVLLSAGVDQAMFEAQVRVACASGASGIVVGRSVWGPAARLPPSERDAWLATEGRALLERLVGMADELGRPWTAVSTPITSFEGPGEGWYRGY